MGEMLPLETKQSGGKTLPHADLQEGVFLEEPSRTGKGKDILLGTWKLGACVGHVHIRQQPKK